ncbi:MAG: KH domain-containing protein [Cyanobacteria bacterium SID2]|nr:KH domain-containing protein [Cyanobacteria bacterium SID2]MBP0004763.1 KH domain-containing protein [Cyanobacteria bacterium SBC]
MSSNKSNRQPASKTPDYAGLTRFLVEPFLEFPDSLSVNCEYTLSNLRVWVRLAFDENDRGRVFGRGGRNLDAIRTTLESISQVAGQSLILEVYGESNVKRESEPTKPRNGRPRSRGPHSGRRRPRSTRHNDS